MNKLAVSIMTILLSSPFVYAANESNTSFNKAKKMLEKDVYTNHRQTLYCGAAFDEKKFVVPPEGFKTDKYVKRAKKIEWEHVVPAENFGRVFKEWRDGDALCVDSKGNSFKGRKCAEKVNTEYKYIQADMFNLYPAIGAVNALRKNYNFIMLPNQKSDFGSCNMKVNEKKAEPPVISRGRIARSYLYMENAYSSYNMSKQQRQLMNAWDKMYPIDAWECERAKKISVLQQSNNLVVQNRCEDKFLW